MTVTYKFTLEKKTTSDLDIYGKNLNSDMASRENLFECDPGVNTLTDGNHFRQYRIVHTEEKPFNCDACEKSFTK